MKKRNSFRLER